MSETVWIIGEIIIGIAVLGVLSAVITAIMVPLLSKRPGAVQILDERYARGELTREQYQQMRQDLEMGPNAKQAMGVSSADGQSVGVVHRPR